MALDRIFDERIGFGKSQIILLCLMSLVEMNDGAQLIVSIIFFNASYTVNFDHPKIMGSLNV